MIQRLQTLYFLIGAALLSMGLWYAGGAGPRVLQNSASAVETGFAVTALLGCLAAVILIFLYKDRKRQLTLASIPSLLAAIALGLQLVLNYEGGFAAIGTDSWIIIGGAALSILFFILGRRGIKNDIKLVRSMDRLR